MNKKLSYSSNQRLELWSQRNLPSDYAETFWSLIARSLPGEDKGSVEAAEALLSYILERDKSIGQLLANEIIKLFASVFREQQITVDATMQKFHEIKKELIAESKSRALKPDPPSQPPRYKMVRILLTSDNKKLLNHVAMDLIAVIRDNEGATRGPTELYSDTQIQRLKIEAFNLSSSVLRQLQNPDILKGVLAEFKR